MSTRKKQQTRVPPLGTMRTQSNVCPVAHGADVTVNLRSIGNQENLRDPFFALCAAWMHLCQVLQEDYGVDLSAALAALPEPIGRDRTPEDQ